MNAHSWLVELLVFQIFYLVLEETINLGFLKIIVYDILIYYNISTWVLILIMLSDWTSIKTSDIIKKKKYDSQIVSFGVYCLILEGYINVFLNIFLSLNMMMCRKKVFSNSSSETCVMVVLSYILDFEELWIFICIELWIVLMDFMDFWTLWVIFLLYNL